MLAFRRIKAMFDDERRAFRALGCMCLACGEARTVTYGNVSKLGADGLLRVSLNRRRYV